MVTAVDGLTESEFLDLAHPVAGRQHECELQLRRIAVQPGVLHNPDKLDPDLTKPPGRSEPGGSAASACPR